MCVSRYRVPSLVRLLNLPQISAAKILENDIPVFVVTFQTQEMLIFRNAKTSEIMVGAENKVEQCHYAAVVTRVEDELDSELTGGWKIVEVRILSRTVDRLVEPRRRWQDDRRAHTFEPAHRLPTKT